MVGPEDEQQDRRGHQQPDQGDHDDSSSARPGPRPGRAPARRSAATTLAATPKIEHVDLGQSVDADGEDRAEGEDCGQPVPVERGRRSGTARRCDPRRYRLRTSATSSRYDWQEADRGAGGARRHLGHREEHGRRTARTRRPQKTATTRMSRPPSAVTPNQADVRRDEADVADQQQQDPAEVAHRPAECRRPGRRWPASRPGAASRCRTRRRTRRRSPPAASSTRASHRYDGSFFTPNMPSIDGDDERRSRSPGCAGACRRRRSAAR